MKTSVAQVDRSKSSADISDANRVAPNSWGKVTEAGAPYCELVINTELHNGQIIVESLDVSKGILFDLADLALADC